MEFKPADGVVMVEIVEKEREIKLHLPDSAQQRGAIHDMVVAAVGENVSEYSVGDKVLTPLPKNGQIAKFTPDGGNEGTYIFWDKEDIFGKFINEENE